MARLGTNLARNLALALGADLADSAPVVPLAGFTGFSAAAYASTSDPGGPPGVNTGFWRAVLFRVLSQASSATRVLMNRYTTPTPVAGYVAQTTGFNATFQFFAVNAANGIVSAPSYTIQAADVGKDMMALCVHDGSFLRLYMNRVEVGSGTAISGYTAATTLTRAGNRSTNTTQPASNITIYGEAAGDAAPSAAQAQAFFDAVKAGTAMTSMPGVTTDAVWVFDSTPTIEDDVGSADLTVTGALTAASNTPNWGW